VYDIVVGCDGYLVLLCNINIWRALDEVNFAS
jgi:hypothetical protein